MSIENNAYRLRYSDFPQPTRFFQATFLDPISSLSWSLEQATTFFKIAIARPALVNSWKYQNHTNLKSRAFTEADDNFSCFLMTVLSWKFCRKLFTSFKMETVQAPVVQKVDSAIRWINLYPVESAIGFPSIYPLDSDLSSGSAIQRLNNRAQVRDNGGTWLLQCIIAKTSDHAHLTVGPTNFFSRGLYENVTELHMNPLRH